MNINEIQLGYRDATEGTPFFTGGSYLDTYFILSKKNTDYDFAWTQDRDLGFRIVCKK